MTEHIVRQRIIDVLAEKNISINYLSKGDKSAQRRLQRQIKEGASITSETISSILEEIKTLSSEWLMTGNGPKYKQNNNLGIPLYKIEAAAGFGNDTFCIEEKDIEARYNVRELESSSFMLHVRGKSMEPTYNNGDIVAVKKVNDRKEINWGKPHLISSSKDGLLIKRIYDDEDGVIAVSDNPTYRPMHIKWDEISGIAKVIGSVKLENY